MSEVCRALLFLPGTPYHTISTVYDIYLDGRPAINLSHTACMHAPNSYRRISISLSSIAHAWIYFSKCLAGVHCKIKPSVKHLDTYAITIEHPQTMVTFLLIISSARHYFQG